MRLTADDLTQIRSLVVEAVLEALEIAVNPRLDAIEADVAELKADIAVLKTDMRSVKAQLTEQN